MQEPAVDEWSVVNAEVDGPRTRIPFRVYSLLAIAIATALTLWTYRPALRADFVFDDVTSVIENPALHWESLSWDALRGLTESVRLPRRIVANFTFALNYVAGGLDPSGYHLVNILVHLGVGAALALFIWLYLRSESEPQDRWARLLAVTLPATLFLVHPVNIQAVTYIVQRMASLVTLFVLLSMAMYLAGRTGALRGPATLWYALAALFWVLGLGSKENAAIVPLVLLTYEWCFHRAEWQDRFRQVWSVSAQKRVVLSVLALSTAALATAGVLAWVGGNPFRLAETWPGRDFNGIERVLTQTRAHWLYLSLLVWPAPGRLNLDHDFAVSRGLLQPPATLFASIGLALLVGVVLYLSFKHPRLGFPLLAYFEFHALESGPVNLELVFEHRMYLPMAMLAVAAAAILDRIRAPARAFALAGGVVCVVLLAGATRARNETWSDPVALAYDIAAKSPMKPRALSNLAGAYRRANRYEEAEDAFRSSLALAPGQWKAHFGLGALYLEMGRPEEALTEFQNALEVQPTNMRAAYSIGQALEDLGRSDEAFRYYMNLGRRLGMAGYAFEAVEPLRRAVAIDSTSSSAHNALGNVYLMAGMRPNAVREYRTALELDPDNVQAVYNLASALEEAGEISEAVQLYQRFVEIAPPELRRQAEAVRQRFPAIGAGNQQSNER